MQETTSCAEIYETNINFERMVLDLVYIIPAIDVDTNWCTTIVCIDWIGLLTVKKCQLSKCVFKNEATWSSLN